MPLDAKVLPSALHASKHLWSMTSSACRQKGENVTTLVPLRSSMDTTPAWPLVEIVTLSSVAWQYRRLVTPSGHCSTVLTLSIVEYLAGHLPAVVMPLDAKVLP